MGLSVVGRPEWTLVVFPSRHNLVTKNDEQYQCQVNAQRMHFWRQRPDALCI
jgi:hypothetical protein